LPNYSRTKGELIFAESPGDHSDTIIINGLAEAGKTRWDYVLGQGIALPTSDYAYISDTCLGDRTCGFDAPHSKDSNFPDMAWAKYAFVFRCGSFARDFTIDFRDYDWKWYYHDLFITYFQSEGKLKYLDQYGTWYVIQQDAELEIWTIFHDSTPNRTALLVPATATTNFCGIPPAMEAGTCGQIKMDGVTYDAPKTLNWGWTTSHTITAFSYLYIGGKKYFFQRWDDGSTQLTRNLTIDDQHSSYTYTAVYSSLALSLEEPNDLEQSRIVPPSDKALDEDLQKALFQEEFEPSTPNAFALLPNHPNPFNPITTIQYQLAEDSQVSLTVYTLLGEEVIRLIDENQPAGAHRVQWNASDRYCRKVASGIYVYKLEAVGSSHRFVQSRKMVLMK